jgi:probable F420-dependent oxidoreductase
MRVGAIIPNAGTEPSALGIQSMAVEAEAAGAESLWVSDHLVFLDRPNHDYPFSDDGVPSWDMTADYYEALTCCAAIASVTERARIGTAVLVLPQRNAFEVAKTAATVDRLSDGRFDLGVGAGWNRDEFETLGYSYETRGKRFNEMLAFLRDAWSGRPGAFDGAELTVPEDVVLVPTPVQEHGVPLLVGGLGPAALRRAARLGDGWLAIAFVDRWDPDRLAEALAGVLRRRDDEGLDGPFRTVLKFHSSPALAERSVELLGEIAELGFDEVMIEPPWSAGIEEGRALIEAAVAR